MDERAHHIQDAAEIYAVAVLQHLAEDRGIALTSDSAAKMAAFVAYAEERGLKPSDFSRGAYSAYKSNVDRHIPLFFDRLQVHIPGARFDFVDVEAEYRNMNLKGDFLIVTDQGHSVSVSLKNYRKSAQRPQCSSGTFNSFVLNFVLDPAGVGMFRDPRDGGRFRGSNTVTRDEVLTELGYGDLVPHLRALDQVNLGIKDRFVRSEEFQFLDEAQFDLARKQCGEQGIGLTLKALAMFSPEQIKNRLLKMTGLDGTEELLLMDPDRSTDSITSLRFHELRHGVQADDCVVQWGAQGQGIEFSFVRRGRPILKVSVPFTINKNGAWISGAPYEGTRLHAKEGVELAYGQRRPKKSKELATSVNTYVDFGAAGIFDP